VTDPTTRLRRATARRLLPGVDSHGDIGASPGGSDGLFIDQVGQRNQVSQSEAACVLDGVVLRGLKAGTGSVDLSLRRHGEDKISPQIIEARGGVEVTASFSG